jgi:ribosomal protein S18 acetylase RimI-like enzyme
MKEIDQSLFDHVYDLMSESFPKNEYRTYNGQLDLLSNPFYQLNGRFSERRELEGFIASWEFSGFRFVEHLAVNPILRGAGIGSKLVIDFLRKDLNKTVVLEVEPPHEEIAQRRISLYKKLGFQMNHYPYAQPALREGESDLPLLIMSYPALLSPVEFDHVKHVLYSKVYGVY